MSSYSLPRAVMAAMTAAALLPAAFASAPGAALPSAAAAPSGAGPAADQTTAGAQPSTADTGPDAQITMPEVTVTALQQSLENAQLIKQKAKMVVDSIVAEDIGKFPDNSVADSLQRITGVQVAQGAQSETTTVLIRGLPNIVTTLNGREIFNSGGREFSFQDLLATAVSGLDVYKSTDATMITGGIAGTVDIHTFHPLDFDGPRVAATYNETYQRYGGHWDPSGSLLLSDRWDTDAGTFGALVNFGITSSHYDYNSTEADNNLNFVLTDGKGNPVHNGQGDLVVGNNSYAAFDNVGWRKRPEANYALQWKPADNLEVYAEGLYTWLWDQYGDEVYGGLPANAVAPTSFTTGGGCFKIGLTGSPYTGQTACPLNSATWSGNFYALTSTQARADWGQNSQNAIGIKWHGDKLRLQSDFSINSSSYENDAFIVDTLLDAYSSPLTFNYQAPTNFGFTGNPQLNASRFFLNGLDQQWDNNTARQFAWAGSGNYSFDNSFIKSVDFGLRFADTKAGQTGATLDQFPAGGAYLANGAPNPANNALSVFGNSYFCNVPTVPSQPTSALTGCYKYLLFNEDNVRAFYGLPPGKLPAQEGQFFNIDEDTYSAFGQINYGQTLFGLPFDGVVGLRFEHVQRQLSAYTYDTVAAAYSPIGLNTNDYNWLPNATFNLHFSDSLQMRLSAGKTVEYPDFTALNPSLTLAPATANTIASGAGGNPNLKPTTSASFDATLEWYFSRVGSLTGGLFYHDITGYIENYNFLENIGGQSYLISGPQSSGGGHLGGLELAYNQIFSWLPGALSGLGLQANYTYIESELSTPAIDGTGFITVPFQNVSKNNYNLVLIYEKYGVSARLAYDYRSRYPASFTAASNLLGNNAQLYDVAPNMLDLTLAYNVTKHVAVVFNATNLNHATFRQYAGAGEALPANLAYIDTSYGLGFRAKF